MLVLGDALRGMSQRLGDVSALHDLACVYRTGGCGGTTSANSTKLSERYAMLAAIPGASSLTSAVGAAADLQGDPWVLAMSAIATAHATMTQTGTWKCTPACESPE